MFLPKNEQIGQGLIIRLWTTVNTFNIEYDNIGLHRN